MDVTLEVLLKAQQGDMDAQNALMCSLYTPVYHFLRKRTGHQETADELCQNVFLKCYERLNHYDQRSGTVYTWVFTIARNTLIDHYRKHQSESVADLSEIPSSGREADTSHDSAARLDARFVAKLLERLPELEADVVTLRAINEMPYTEISKIIKKRESAVRQIYSRALKKLRVFAQETQSL